MEVQEPSLSDPTILEKTNNSPVSFTTNVLFVGGAYAGLSAINTFITEFKQKRSQIPNNFNENNSLSITLIEPRAGLLNVLGMPRCIVDSEFSATQFIPYDRLANIRFDNIISHNEEVLQTLQAKEDTNENKSSGITVNYVHGLVTYLDGTKAQYNLVKPDSSDIDHENLGVIDFDYVILASGRDRNWPTTPKAYTYDSFIEEMKQSMDKIDSHKVVSIIGAGAVGIELAGDLKHYRPDKHINLIHPHDKFPPEPLAPEFKDETYKSLERCGINILLNTRVKATKTIDLGTTTGNLETVNGDIIESDLNIWCTTHRNNTGFLSKSITQEFVTAKQNIKVNEYLQLKNDHKVIDNFFVLGDLVDLPIIKSAGWALYHGRQVANNLSSILLEHKLVEASPDPNQIPKGMVLVAGNGDLICELAGTITTNVPDYVEEYKDYCFGKIRATLDV